MGRGPIKAILTLALALFSAKVLADEVICSNATNSEFQIRILFNANLMSQVSRIHRDQGAAGWGDLQEVALIGLHNVYVVTEEHLASAGFPRGTLIQLKYDGMTLKSAELIMTRNSPGQAEIFQCY